MSAVGRETAVAPAEWQSWQWQMQHRVRDAEALARWVPPTEDERRAIDALADRFHFVITPYYASLMDPRRSETAPCVVRWCRVGAEMQRSRPGLADPLDEVAHSPVKNVIRVYPDRIAFCVNNECALYCRFCLRKRMVGEPDWAMKKRELWVLPSTGSRETPEIRDVLLTGGDPLVYSDDRVSIGSSVACADPPRRDRAPRHAPARDAALPGHRRICARC